MPTADTPTPDDVKTFIQEETDIDYDEDEFESLIDKWEEKLDEQSDDRGFAAYAAAKQEYGITVDSDYQLPSTRGEGVDAEDQNLYTVEDIREGRPGMDDEDSNESFKIEGYVKGFWNSISDEGKPRRNIRLLDTTGDIWCMASGEDAVEEFDRHDISRGDFIRLVSVQGFHGEPREPGEDDFYMVMMGPYMDTEKIDHMFDLDDVAKSVEDDVVDEEEFVTASGRVANYRRNSYVGCAFCKSNFDTDEHSACKKCGGKETREWFFDSLRIRMDNGDTVSATLGPGIEPDHGEPEFERLTVWGDLETNENQEGTEFEEISVAEHEFPKMDEDDMVPPSEMETDDDDEDEEVGEPPTSSVSTEDTDDESDTEEAESDDEGGVDDSVAVDEDLDLDGDHEWGEMADSVETQVEDLAIDLPATSPVKILRNKYGIEDDDVIRTVFKLVAKRDNIRVTIEGDESLDQAKYPDISLAPPE